MTVNIQFETKENDKESVLKVLNELAALRGLESGKVKIKADTKREDDTVFDLFSKLNFVSNIAFTVRTSEEAKPKRCIDCSACVKGYFKSKPDTYVCIGTKVPHIISDIKQECTESRRKDA